MFKKIVVGCAEDQAGKDAVVLAAQLAALLESDWTVVFPYQLLLSPVPADVIEQRTRSEVQALTAGIADLREPVYHWSSSSWPVHALHEMAMYEKAELTVFGAARGKHAHLHVSLMERIVHDAPCAIAVAPEHYAETATPRLKRVGVGFASSLEGTAALHTAWSLAARSGAQLDVIAGAELEPELAGYARSAQGCADAEREIFEQTSTALLAATAELGDEVPIKPETINGPPAEILIERSSELDILLLGSRAHGPLHHALTGGVSARVMRDAHCPVLTVPRGVARERVPAHAREAVAD
ncbi:MAG: universal stress protein [Solirubrobacteraceae bacterium]